jgi:hypothetical protein
MTTLQTRLFLVDPRLAIPPDSDVIRRQLSARSS